MLIQKSDNMCVQLNLCQHLAKLEPLKKPKNYSCEYCNKIGGHWENLLTCQGCGITLCCDFSTNQHKSNHAQDFGHAVAISAKPNENWGWCYIDKQGLELEGFVNNDAH